MKKKKKKLSFPDSLNVLNVSSQPMTHLEKF